MSNQPDTPEQQANADDKNGSPEQPSGILKTENSAKVTTETGSKGQKPQEKIQTSPLALGKLMSIWMWIKQKSSEASLADWAMVLFTFIIAASTIVFTVYAGRQWQEMHTGGEDTKTIAEQAQRQTAVLSQQMGATAALAHQAVKQSAVAVQQMGAMAAQAIEAKSQADATKDVADAAKKQAEAAIAQSQGIESMGTAARDQAITLHDQVETMQRQFGFLQTEAQSEQRAWVKPSFTIPSIDNVTSATVHVQNVGKSPALRTIINGWFEIVDAGLAPVFAFAGQHTVDDIAILYPNDPPDPSTDTPVPLVATGTISAADIRRRLADGMAYVVLWGSVDYLDQFGEHWDMFCTWRSYAAGRFNADPCIRFNRVGDGLPPIPQQPQR